jgi:ribonuclease R
VVDLYRTFLMKDRIGERFEGTVTAVVGSGLFVQLDAPFVDVLVRLEDLGHDHWEVDDEALRVIAARSGDVIALGDRLFVELIDASLLRRTVYAKRVGEVVPRAELPTRRETGRGRGKAKHGEAKDAARRQSRTDRRGAPKGGRPERRGETRTERSEPRGEKRTEGREGTTRSPSTKATKRATGASSDRRILERASRKGRKLTQPKKKQKKRGR